MKFGLGEFQEEAGEQEHKIVHGNVERSKQKQW